MAPHGHEYVVIGGAGGWEGCECRRCGHSGLVTPFGFMWREVLGRFLARYRCPGHRPKRARGGI